MRNITARRADRRRWPLAALFALTVGAQAAALEGPAGARLLVERTAFGRLTAPLEPARDAAPASATLDGERTLRVWALEPPAPTPLAAVSALRDQLAAQGFETALLCVARACGGYDFYAALELAPPPEMALGLDDFAHLTLRRGDSALLAATASALGGTLRLQAILVETRKAGLPPDPDPAPDAAAPAATPILSALARQGRVALDGVGFVAGSFAFTEASGATLDAAAAALRAAPDLRMVVVGHTDASGELDVNIKISRARARAVADALIARGVAAERLSAEGAAWLSPRASNRTEAGRARNRRVELVAR